MSNGLVELAPLSAAKRAEREDARLAAFAQAAVPLLVEPLQEVLAEQHNQPLGAVEVAGRAGYQDLLRSIDPAIGQDFVYTIPAGKVLYPLSVMCRLTTSAVVGDRSLTVEYLGGDEVRFLVMGAEVTLAASQSQAFCWHPEAGERSWPVNDCAIAPLAQQFLYPGTALTIHNEGGDVDDQIDLVRLSGFFYPLG